MSPQLQQILTEIDQLSPMEQMEVLSHTVTRVKQQLDTSEISPETPESILDPDIGLAVKPEVIEQLLAIRQNTNPTLTPNEVKQRLGLV
jgi:hypothetical protein